MGQWQRLREIEDKIKLTWMKMACVAICWIEVRSGRATVEKRGKAIRRDDFLLESDYTLEAQGEPYKSLLIKTGQFIDGLMSLGY